MKVRTLYEMIKYLQYGTNLHIGVLFLNHYGNEMCDLPYAHRIHSKAVCEAFKLKSKQATKKCFRCRNMAIKKAMSSRKAFGGVCINGVFEYSHPVTINNDVACIIYVGNILPGGDCSKKLINVLDNNLISTLEHNFSEEKCEIICDLIEEHILFLLKEYGYRNHRCNPLCDNIKHYIDSNLEYNIEISHIASNFHYNQQYIGKLFRTETGYTIKQYINNRRMEQAKVLIQNTNDTIIDISTKVGFNNVTYFNRQFKKCFNITPLQFRNIKNNIRSIN